MSLLTSSSFWIAFLGGVVAIDHVLAAMPSVAANSTFQLLSKGLLSLAGLFPSK